MNPVHSERSTAKIRSQDRTKRISAQAEEQRQADLVRHSAAPHHSCPSVVRSVTLAGPQHSRVHARSRYLHAGSSEGMTWHFHASLQTRLPLGPHPSLTAAPVVPNTMVFRSKPCLGPNTSAVNRSGRLPLTDPQHAGRRHRERHPALSTTKTYNSTCWVWEEVGYMCRKLPT